MSFREPGQPARFEVKIVLSKWRIEGKKVEYWRQGAESELAKLLNDGWMIVGQSECATDFGGWHTWTLTRLKA